MARMRNEGPPRGRGGSGMYSEVNPSREGESSMLVVAVNDDLAEFCGRVFDEIDSRLRAHGGETALEREQVYRYVATAIKVRVEAVDRPRFRSLGHGHTGMNVETGWALPVPIHNMLSSLGIVTLDGGTTRVVPIWDKSGDTLVMDVRERDEVTRHLRAALTGIGVKFENDISKDRDGQHSVMVLTYLPGAGEWWSSSVLSEEGAKHNMLLGLRPVTDVVRGSNGADYALVDTDAMAVALRQLPFWVPEWRMQRRIVVRFLNEAATLAS